ncbi:hypothetical protein C0989_000681 [Termitomyces sp. Mn162]|nr:hypothetical protein C0989_000681 [Termitomyces sp. Mn162]
MADTACLFDSPPHPWEKHMKRDLSGRVSKRTSRTLKPVKYYYDLGLSKIYRPEDIPLLEQPPWGGDRTVPEHFAPDALRLRWMFTVLDIIRGSFFSIYRVETGF